MQRALARPERDQGEEGKGGTGEKYGKRENGEHWERGTMVNRMGVTADDPVVRTRDSGQAGPSDAKFNVVTVRTVSNYYYARSHRSRP